MHGSDETWTVGNAKSKKKKATGPENKGGKRVNLFQHGGVRKEGWQNAYDSEEGLSKTAE